MSTRYRVSKKVMVVLLVMMMLLSTTQQIFNLGDNQASAAGGSFALGAGTELDPFQISTADELYAVRHYLGAISANKYFKLTKDIDLSSYSTNFDSGAGWEPIGSDNSKFTGNFNGAGYTISNLYINRPTSNFQALFGTIDSSAAITNIKLNGVNVTGSEMTGSLVGQTNGTVSFASASGEVSGANYVGGLIGTTTGGTTVNSNANVEVTSIDMYIGGLIGFVESGGIVANNYATGDVTGADYTGGLIGNIINTPSSNNYATGNVNGTNGVGGLIGSSSSNAVTNSFALGSVTGTRFVGGLIGINQAVALISNSYASGKVTGNSSTGGLIGFVMVPPLPLSNVFYDSTTTGQTDTGKGEPKTTSEMQQQATYTGWTFDSSNWTIDSAHNNGYPYLSGLPSPEHVVYSGNGATGTPPISKRYTQNQAIIVADNTDLAKTGYIFGGWNTKLDGSGDAVLPGVSYTIVEDTTLYAQWLLPSPALTADTTNNDNGSPIEILFTDDGTWGASITEIKSGNISVSEATYTVSNGKITINAGVLEVGTHTITVMAAGYATASVQQTIVPSSSLSSLNVSSGALNQVFAATTTSYTQSVANEVTSLKVTPTVADPLASVEVSVNGGASVAVPNGQQSAELLLNVGANTITVTVTASNGPTKVYTIIVTRISNNALLASLTVDQGTLSPAFTSQNPTYKVDLPNTASSLDLTLTLMDPNQSILAVGADQISVTNSVYVYSATHLLVGPNPIVFEVIAEDGTSNPYHITVNRAATRATSPSAPSGGGGGGSSIPTDGKLTLPTGQSGQVSLGDAVTASIPTGATDKELKLTITKLLESQNLLTNKQVLATNIYEILKNFPENFSKPVTLTFVFDPANVKKDQRVAVFYYDEVKKVWVEVTGGKINGDRISVEVDHFTKYAVFLVDPAVVVPVPDKPTDIITETKFSDIAKHWAEASIKQAVNSGIVKGYTDGTFKPNATVTRAEFAVMLMNTLKPQGNGAELTFTDNAKIGAWARKAVAQAVQAGIVKGNQDGSFRPNAEVTRAEMAVMIANALGQPIEANVATSFTDDKNIPAWAKGSVAIVEQASIVQGKNGNKFSPQDNATRAEAVTVLMKMLAQQSN